jgi:hypothetical protein
MTSLIGFPNPVNGKAARTVPGGVLVLSMLTLVLSLTAGYPVGTRVVLGLMIVAAGLESIFAYCVGCKLFAGLMRLGLIPAATCEACANVSLRVSTSAP